MKKILAVFMAVTLLLCSMSAYAAKFKFEDKFEYADKVASGANQVVASDANNNPVWRTKTEAEGKMGLNAGDAYASGKASANIGEIRIKNGDLYIDTARTRSGEATCRYNDSDINNLAAAVYCGDHSTITANQQIYASMLMTHYADSFAIRFQSKDNNAYILSFGGEWLHGFNGGTDDIAYQIIKLENGTAKLLKEVKQSDATLEATGCGFIPTNVWVDITITYIDGTIGFRAGFDRNGSNVVWTDSVADSSPFNYSGNDAGVWIYGQGNNDGNRYIKVREFSYESYGNEATSGTGASGDFKYSYVQEVDENNEIVSDTCTITGFNDTLSTKPATGDWNMVIPDVIDGHTVVAIADSAFESSSIDIPTYITFEGTNVKTIGNKAFKAFNGLRQIVLPEGLTSLGWDAFRGCNYINRIELPSTLTDIQDGLLHGAGPNATKITVVIKADTLNFTGGPSESGSIFNNGSTPIEFYVVDKTVENQVKTKATLATRTYTYNYIDCDELVYNAVTGKVSIVTDSDISGAVLIFAGYDNDSLTISSIVRDVDLTNGVKSSWTVDGAYKNGTYENVKVFLWNGFSEITPITNFVEVPQN